MNAPAIGSIDLVEELRLRRWARINHVPAGERDLDWHPIILNEMHHKDAELDEQRLTAPMAGFAPLGEILPNVHPPHRAHGPRFLASPQRSSELYYT